jgi:hypothetical protein
MRFRSSDLAFIGFRANRTIDSVAVLKSVAGRDYFIDDFESPPVPDLFVEAANDGHVLQ